MSRARILLADNNLDFLLVWAELLRRRDYEVITVSSIATAEETARHGEIDVAVLDLRLEDDGDANDVSGLILARELALDPFQIPTIIMSGDPNEDTLIWAVHESRPSCYLSVVSKSQGPDVLLKEIAKAILSNRP